MTGTVRPRVASVVAVVWLYLGPPWVLVGGLGTYGYYRMQLAIIEMGGVAPRVNVPLVFLWFPITALVLGLAGTFGAVSLLGCRAIGRSVMRFVNVGAALLMLAFTVNWMLAVTESRYGASWEQVQTALLGLLAGLLTSVPFLVMARKLGSPELLAALR